MAKLLKDQSYMYRCEFAKAFAGRLGVTPKEAEDIADMFLETLRDTWSKGRSVCFKNFGVFELRIMTERMGRNPKTMEDYLIPAAYKPAFRPTKMLREDVSRAIEGRK